MTPRLLFAGVFHWNAGSAQTVAQYAAVAPMLNCEIGVSTQLSRLDDTVGRYLPLVDDLAWATHVVLVFESRQFLRPEQLELVGQIPRARRIVLDPDGHWGPLATAGVDDNGGPEGNERWNSLFRELSDIILQPRIGSRPPDGAHYFPYFGMPRPEQHPSADVGATDLDVQYVGANWWRWDQMTRLFDAGLTAGVPPERLQLAGRWWTTPSHPDHTEATRNEPRWLADRGIRVKPPVPFGDVVRAMSTATITPVLARPLLAQMGMLTPRMLETLASTSIPVHLDGLAYVDELYGPLAELVRLDPAPADTIRNILASPRKFRRATDEIRRDAYERFRYEAVLKRLLTFIA